MNSTEASDTIQKEVKLLTNKITLQNALPLLQQIRQYYVLPDKQDTVAGHSPKYAPSVATNAIANSLLQHLTEGLGDGEVRMRAPSILPLAIIPKAVQLCDGSHSLAIILKALVDSFMQRIHANEISLAAVQNLTTFFCLLFELDAYDFQFVSTFSIQLANLLKVGRAEQQRTCCELLLLVLHISSAKIHRADPSWVAMIIDLATSVTAYDECDPSMRSRIQILCDFLQELKYEKNTREKRRLKRRSDDFDTSNHKLGTLALRAHLDDVRTILCEFSKAALTAGNQKQSVLSDGKLAVTWEQCVSARDARWWYHVNQPSVPDSTTAVDERSIIETPLFRDAIQNTRFPFRTHPYEGKTGFQADNRIDTPVRIRLWNALLESQEASQSRRPSLDGKKEATFHLLQRAFANSKFNQSPTKKLIDRYAKDFIVVFDMLIEKLSVHLALTGGHYLFQRVPILSAFIQHVCQESREFRHYIQVRTLAWMDWVGTLDRKNVAGDSEDEKHEDLQYQPAEQLLLLLVQSQYTAIYIFHQRSRGSFLAKRSALLASQSDDFTSKDHLFLRMNLKEILRLPDGDLTKSEIYFILLFSCLLIMARNENEFYQMFHPWRTYSKKKIGQCVDFLTKYFIQHRKFLTLLPLLEMQWKSLREAVYTQAKIEKHIVDQVLKLHAWLSECSL
ncbi:AATS-ALA protein [Perkinsela sp. CCAP 1560/4]|nr:AATS-ALA protein [Perkinsela sp. CCAP 1560/4]|eukprot:KNH09772.1 AATS-ALA protein [Perkinsela sp. CCAP 1560/4]